MITARSIHSFPVSAKREYNGRPYAYFSSLDTGGASPKPRPL